jgi:hypothetical protein
VSGIVVLDIDDADGEDAVRSLLPTDVVTVTQLTGGGRHIVFQHPGGEVKNAIRFMPGADIKGDNGYIVAAPSVHVSGRRYLWADGRDPVHLTPAPFPRELHDVLLVSNRLGAEAAHVSGRALPIDETTARVRAYIAKLPTGLRNGDGRNDACYRLSCFLLRDLGLDDEMARQWVEDWNRSNVDPLGAHEVDSTMASARRNGQRTIASGIDRWARSAPHRVRPVSALRTTNTPAVREVQPGTRPRRLVMQRASEIEAEEIRWLWPGYIPFGKVTTLEGDPSVGKSTMTMKIAAAVSRGRGDWLPGGIEFEGRDVFIVSYEDGARDTIRPRLEAAAADLTRVHVIQGVVTELGHDLVTLPTDIPDLEASVRDHSAALVIMDPLMASFSQAIDSYRDHHVRRALAPLCKLAEATGAAMLVVRHLPKATGRKAINMGGGSVGIGAAARSVLVIGASEQNSAHRILAVVKCNVAAMAPSLEFSIESGTYAVEGRVGTTGTIVWHGTSRVTADDLAAQRGDTTEPGAATDKVLAAECLREWLGDGPLSKEEVLSLARRQGFSERTLQRGAQGLVVTTRQGHGREHTTLWSLRHGLSTRATSPHMSVGASENGANGLSLANDGDTASYNSVKPPPAATRATAAMHLGNGASGLEGGVL